MDGATIDELMRSADAAMYGDKARKGSTRSTGNLNADFITYADAEDISVGGINQ